MIKFLNPLIIALMILLTGCNASEYYARQRAGGNTFFSHHYSDTVSRRDYRQPANEHDLPLMKNDDQAVFKHKEKSVFDSLAEPRPAKPILEDTIPAPDTSFLIDDGLAQAFMSPAINTLGALFGFLTMIHADFAFLAVGFYVLAIPAAILIGIILFSVALYKYNNGLIDHRNKKYLWLWVATFLLSLALVVLSLYIFF